MKSKIIFSIVSLFSSVLLISNACSNENIKKALGEDYLAHWYSIDTKRYGTMEVNPIEDDKYPLYSLSFMSDDGQNVYGRMAYPKNQSDSKKLAILMHPMGSDQKFWWGGNKSLQAGKITDELLASGYTVVSLDARIHGQRANQHLSPKSLIPIARGEEPRLYIETIVGSVRDYRYLLRWAESHIQPKEIITAGYSMGAQMSLLLASYEPSVTGVLAMVPPYVTSDTSPVAPRMHLDRIEKANVLWLAGENDLYSSRRQTELTFQTISSEQKRIEWFDSGHRLPIEYLAVAKSFFSPLTRQEQ